MEHELSIEKARAKLGDIVRDARRHGILTLITFKGQPAAMVTPILEDSDRRTIAEAWELCKRLGDTEMAGMIDDLLVIIQRLTEDDPIPRVKARSKP